MLPIFQYVFEQFFLNTISSKQSIEKAYTHYNYSYWTRRNFLTGKHVLLHVFLQEKPSCKHMQVIQTSLR